MSLSAKSGFTLVELLVVIAIVGMLSTVAVIATSSARSKARFAAGQSFEATVQRAVGSDIVGEWLFNEGSGATAADTSGYNHNGTVTGATWTGGVSGTALNFTGSGTYVSLGNDNSLDPANFTVTAWVKPGDFSGSYNYIYSNARDCCGTYNGINFMILANSLCGSVWNSGAASVCSNSRISNDPVWTFVAFSYNGSKLALYINGHLDNSASSSLGVGQPASFNTYIGALSNCPGSCVTVGAIDQVRLYSTAVVAEDIRKIYLAEKERRLAAR